MRWVARAGAALSVAVFVASCDRTPPARPPPSSAPAMTPAEPPASPPPAEPAPEAGAPDASPDVATPARPPECDEFVDADEVRGRSLGWPEHRASEVHGAGVLAADVVGVVVDRYTPPPCPRGADCKPTLPRHLRVADPSAPREPILRLIVRDVAPFRVGSTYVLSTCLYDAPLMGSLHGRVRGWRER